MSTAKKKILFVAYGGGHVAIVIPLVRAVQAAGDLDFEAMALTTAGADLDRAGIPHFGFRELADPARDAHALAIGRNLLEGNTHPKVPEDESIAYLGLSYADLEQRLGASEAARLYAESGRYNFLPLTVLERAIERVKPDLVVATNTPRAERAAILAARKKGIPAVCIIDLFAGPGSADWIAEPGFADRVCVLSESVRQAQLRKGIPAEKLVITGNPAFDRLADPSLAEKARRYREEQGLKPGELLVTWGSSGEPKAHPQYPRQVERHLVSLLDRHPEWRLFLRFHPSEAVDPGPLPPRARVSPRTEDLATLLMASDVLVTTNSTVGLEAALLDRPLVSLVVPEFGDWDEYLKMGIAHGARSISDLEPAIVAALADGRTTPGQTRVPMSLVPRPGQATANVLRVFRELLS